MEVVFAVQPKDGECREAQWQGCRAGLLRGISVGGAMGISVDGKEEVFSHREVVSVLCGGDDGAIERWRSRIGLA